MFFEHQIPFPSEKAIQCFLWNDYFHDSNITNIEFTHHGVELTIISIRDMDDDKRKPKDNVHEYFEKHQEEYIYKLIFDNCHYFSSERRFSCNDFLFGVFLDTAALHQVQAKSKSANKKKFYHYRIVYADGYLDLIFSGFRIRKMIGRIHYPDVDIIQDYPEHWLKQNRDDAQPIDSPFSSCWLNELLRTGDSLERRYSLMYMIRHNQFPTIDDARNIMNLDWWEYEEAREAAIWAIGLLGDESDLPMLYNEHFRIEGQCTAVGISPASSIVPKRHVMDAVEQINRRCTKNISVHDSV